MSHYIYRQLDLEKANHLIDLCDDNNIDYDIWNPEDILMGKRVMEIGLKQQDWDKLQPFMN